MALSIIPFLSLALENPRVSLTKCQVSFPCGGMRPDVCACLGRDDGRRHLGIPILVEGNRNLLQHFEKEVGAVWLVASMHDVPDTIGGLPDASKHGAHLVRLEVLGK